MKNVKTIVLAAGLVMGALISNAHADYVQDGDFTVPTVNGAFNNYTTGQSFGPWNVTSGDVDLIGSYWMQPNPNNGSVDLDGFHPGAISQTLSTIPAGSFLLSFSFSGNPDGGNPLKTLAVSVGNVVNQIFTYNTATAGNTDSNMKFITETLAFTTTGATTLNFASLDASGANGPAISNVSISAVPLPAGLPMFVAAVLAMVGFHTFRKRQQLA